MNQEVKQTEEIPEYFQLTRLSYNGGFFAIPSATVEVEFGSNPELKKTATIGVGPIDACFKAIIEATGMDHKLLRYDGVGINGGTEASAKSVVQLYAHEEIFEGTATHRDTVASAALSYISALNKIKHWELSKTDKTTV